MNPDFWLIVKFIEPGGEAQHRLIVGNRGDEQCKLTTKIRWITDDGDYWKVKTHSGSIYTCLKNLAQEDEYLANFFLHSAQANTDRINLFKADINDYDHLIIVDV